MIHLAKEDRDAGRRAYDAARRYAGTEAWEPESERRLADAAKRLASTGGGE